MTPLRQKMTDKMILRGFASSTQEMYLYSATQLSRFYNRSHENIPYPEIEAWFLQLVKNDHLAPATIRIHFNGLKFLYCNVLGKEQFLPGLKLPKKQQKIPELLSRGEVNAILEATDSLRDKMLLTVCYGCGLRVSEVTSLALSDIDSKQHLLRIEQSKGNKDRYVPLPETLIQQLREYWRADQPATALFPGRKSALPIGISSVQKIYTKAKRQVKIEKTGGIHSLRHAFASHQLEKGMPLPQLKDILGHANLSTTMRYFHWYPSNQAKSFDAVAHLNEEQS